MSFKRFSLIELLVVIAIFSFILSLINPTLKSAIKKTHILECKNKLKNLYQILNFYVDDHARYPTAYRLINNGIPHKNHYHVTWDDLLGQGYDGRNLSMKEIDKWDAPNFYEAYVCPNQFENGTTHRGHMRSYTFNGSNSESNVGGITRGKLESASTAEIPAPSQTILLTEILGILGNRWNAPELRHPTTQIKHSLENPSYYHDHSFNYLFADGHLELLVAEETFNPEINSWHTSYPGKYWTRDPND